jgi:helix-turn-helix protein
VSTVDLLLHPVRLRILQAFLGGRELTTNQLAAELPDLPSGSLYRHVSLLAAGGVLTVGSERRVRGAVERTYALRLEGSLLGPAEMADFSRDDHAHAFGTFVAAMLSAYERYLAQPDADPVRDGATYSMNALWLSDDEYAQFLRDVATLVQPRLTFGPEAGRRRRLIASAFLPLARSHDADGGNQ